MSQSHITRNYISTILEDSQEADSIHDDLTKLTESIRVDRKKRNEYQLIKEVAFSYAEADSGLSSDLQSKVHDILMSAEVELCLNLSDGSSLFDFNALANETLSYEEKEKVREAVQQGLIHKRQVVFEELLELGITIDEHSCPRSCLALSIEDKVLFDFKNKLNETQRLYVVKLQELMEVLEQIVHLKRKTLPDVANLKASSCQVQLNLCNLKTEVWSNRARVDIFAETTSSMNAYREIIKDILKQQAECKDEIEKLEQLKEKYKQVSCMEYNDILKSYVQYKSGIVKKIMLYNQLRGK